MKDKEDDIEDLFRNRFENEESSVSPIVWENIRKTLPKESPFIDLLFFQSLLFWCLSCLLIASVIGAAIAYHRILITKRDTAIKHNVKNKIQTLSSSEHNSIVLFTEQTNSFTPVDAGLQKEFISDDKRSHQQSSMLTDRVNSASYTAKANSKKSNPILFSTKKKTSKLLKANGFKNKKASSFSPIPSFLNAEKKSPLEKTNRHHQIPDDSEQRNEPRQKKSSVLKKENASGNKHLPVSNTNEKEANYTPFVHNASSEDSKKMEPLHLQLSNKDKLSTDSKNHPESLEIGSDTLLKSNISRYHDALTEKNSVKINTKRDSSQSMSTDTFIAISTVSDSTPNTLTIDSIMPAMDPKENASLRSYRKEAKELSGTVNEIFSTTKYESGNSRRKKNIQKNDSTSSNSNSPITTSTLLNTEIKKDSLASTTDSTQTALPDSIQTKKSSEKKKSEESIANRWSVDLLGSGALTGSTIKARDANYQAAVNAKKDRSKNLPGYTFGVTINYKLNNKFSLSTGILYTLFSEQYHFNYTLKKTAWMYVDSTWQYVQVDSINNDKTVKDQYRFLSIPLQVSYTFLTKGKLSLSATAGIRSNILLKGVTYLVNSNGTDVMELNNGFRSLNFSYLATLEMQYQFKPHMALLAQPVFNYSANSIYNSSSPIKQKLYSVGVTIGLRITF